MADPVAADEPRPDHVHSWVDGTICRICGEWSDPGPLFVGAEARSLSDSEPPPLDLMERAYIHLHLCKDDHEGDADLHDSIRLWLSGQPQPALPSEPPPGYKSWADVDLELDEAEGDTGAEPERERAGDPLDVLRQRMERVEGEGGWDHKTKHGYLGGLNDAIGLLSSQSPVASEETP